VVWGFGVGEAAESLSSGLEVEDRWDLLFCFVCCCRFFRKEDRGLVRIVDGLVMHLDIVISLHRLTSSTP